VRIASIATFLIAAAVLIDWLTGAGRLKSLVAGTLTMKANTALLFMIGGAALWLAA
jgi:hypothetical protein